MRGCLKHMFDAAMTCLCSIYGEVLPLRTADLVEQGLGVIFPKENVWIFRKSMLGSVIR